MERQNSSFSMTIGSDFRYFSVLGDKRSKIFLTLHHLQGWLPVAAMPPGSVPAGGKLTGGWPQLGGQGQSAPAASAEPIQAAEYAARQAQLRQEEGRT